MIRSIFSSLVMIHRLSKSQRTGCVNRMERQSSERVVHVPALADSYILPYLSG